MLEAELFGAEAGAFTGATKLRVGRFEAAHGGTLLLGLVVGSKKPAAIEAPFEPANHDVGERAQLQEALARANGVVSKAAVELGLSRQALYRRMERLGLSISKRVE